ncbi:hypothetical protein V8E54_008813 [Elaphomyces granulatus]
MAKIGVLPSTFHRSSHSAVDGRTLPLPGYKAETQQKSLWTTDVDIVEQDWDTAISPNIRGSSHFRALVTFCI